MGIEAIELGLRRPEDNGSVVGSEVKPGVECVGWGVRFRISVAQCCGALES